MDNFIPQQYDNPDADPAAEQDLPASEPPRLTKDGKIPRPPNAWILYRSDRVRDLARQKDRPKRPQSSVSKELSEEWKTCPPQIKSYYERLAELKKAEHEIAYPEYRFCPMKKELRDQQIAEKKAERARRRAEKKNKSRYTPYPQRLTPANHTPYYAASASTSYTGAGPSPPASGAPSPCTSSDESEPRQAGPSRSGPSSSRSRSTKSRSSKSSARSIASSSQSQATDSPSPAAGGVYSWPSGSRDASPSTSQLPASASVAQPQQPAEAPEPRAPPSMEEMQDKFFLPAYPGSWQPAMPPTFEATPDASWSMQPAQSEYDMMPPPPPPFGPEAGPGQWSGVNQFATEPALTFSTTSPSDPTMDPSQNQAVQDFGHGDLSTGFDITAMGAGNEWGTTDALLDELALGDPLRALLQTTDNPSVYSISNLDYNQFASDAPPQIDVALQGQDQAQGMPNFELETFEQMLRMLDQTGPVDTFNPGTLPTIPEGVQSTTGTEDQGMFDDAALMQFLNFDAAIAPPAPQEMPPPPVPVQTMPVASMSSGYVPPAGAAFAGVRRVAGSWKPPIMSPEEPVEHVAPHYWGVSTLAN
ncbi:hypothetical protein CERSUDRAFT_123639 [Gelatoporia subvermispora B]|uniref:HMG box domain-containing protein n=1 Tax=Ceriporiopsis subvermispora (strain B) TaxID=914234 RepID=M2QZU8_CERS8|nr:hypothetical protein CERSUDRAFT_123639 [Gelatoporia subvermispora B]